MDFPAAPEGDAVPQPGGDNEDRQLMVVQPADEFGTKGVAKSTNKKLTSRFRGVCWNKKNKRWQAAINSSGKYLYLGSYDTQEEAARMFDKAAVRIRKNKAKLNYLYEDYIDANGEVLPDEQVESLLLEACNPTKPRRSKNKPGSDASAAGGALTVGDAGRLPTDGPPRTDPLAADIALQALARLCARNKESGAALHAAPGSASLQLLDPQVALATNAAAAGAAGILWGRSGADGGSVGVQAGAHGIGGGGGGAAAAGGAAASGGGVAGSLEALPQMLASMAPGLSFSTNLLQELMQAQAGGAPQTEAGHVPLAGAAAHDPVPPPGLLDALPTGAAAHDPVPPPGLEALSAPPGVPSVVRPTPAQRSSSGSGFGAVAGAVGAANLGDGGSGGGAGVVGTVNVGDGGGAGAGAGASAAGAPAMGGAGPEPHGGAALRQAIQAALPEGAVLQNLLPSSPGEQQLMGVTFTQSPTAAGSVGAGIWNGSAITGMQVYHSAADAAKAVRALQAVMAPLVGGGVGASAAPAAAPAPLAVAPPASGSWQPDPAMCADPDPNAVPATSNSALHTSDASASGATAPATAATAAAATQPAPVLHVAGVKRGAPEPPAGGAAAAHGGGGGGGGGRAGGANLMALASAATVDAPLQRMAGLYADPTDVDPDPDPDPDPDAACGGGERGNAEGAAQAQASKRARAAAPGGGAAAATAARAAAEPPGAPLAGTAADLGGLQGLTGMSVGDALSVFLARKGQQ